VLLADEKLKLQCERAKFEAEKAEFDALQARGTDSIALIHSELRAARRETEKAQKDLAVNEATVDAMDGLLDRWQPLDLAGRFRELVADRAQLEIGDRELEARKIAYEEERIKFEEERTKFKLDLQNRVETLSKEKDELKAQVCILYPTVHASLIL